MQEKTNILNLYICFLFLAASLDCGARPVRDTLLADSIFRYICQQNIQHPEIVMKQAIAETGWFTSPFLMSKNNLFGFKNKKYLSFNSWQESIDYYKRWQDRHYKNKEEDYLKFLVRIKYATKKYPALLKKINYNKTCE